MKIVALSGLALALLLPKLEGGIRIVARAATVYAPEGDVATGLAGIQARFPQLEIGSYPFFRPSGPGSTIVVRGTDRDAIPEVSSTVLCSPGTAPRTAGSTPRDTQRSMSTTSVPPR